MGVTPMADHAKKNILLIDGHPDAKSFGAAMAETYAQGARKAGYPVEKLRIRDLKFDPVLHYGYREPQALEPDLLDAQRAILRAGHVAITLPVWWGGVPGLFKGFIDRTFVGGFSHRFNKESNSPEGLLKGRSASVIYTQGAPKIYSRWIVGDPFWKMIRRATLSFCGFSPVRRMCFDKAKSGTAKDRECILEKVYALGGKGF